MIPHVDRSPHVQEHLSDQGQPQVDLSTNLIRKVLTDMNFSNP